MGLKQFTKGNSLISKLCSYVLSGVMVLSLVFGSMVLQQDKEVEASTAPYRNVMYYGEWSIYAGQNYFKPSGISGDLITHLNFAFIDFDANGDLVLCDEYADFDVSTLIDDVVYGGATAGILGAMKQLRSENPNMKIGISVGGWTRSGDFSEVAASDAKRKNFANNITKFVDYLGFDFVDIDWEYPTAVRAADAAGNGVSVDEGCPGSEADTRNYTLLLQEIRNSLHTLGAKNDKYYELSVAMSASSEMLAKVEIENVFNIVDFANMMTYDLNGAWNDYTGHQTALYTNESYNHETQPQGAFSADATVKYLEQFNIDKSKIVIGVAPYTRGWAGVQNNGPDASNPGLYATATPNSVKAADGTTSGTYGYSDIDTLKSQYSLKEYYDEKAQAAYLYSADTGYFFTYDNERSVAAKGAYVKEKGLGGLIAWMASLDADDNGDGKRDVITRAMKESLYGSSALPVNEIKVSKVDIGATVAATSMGYEITITNNETVDESNTALKRAEAVGESITFPKVYIKTKSGATFTAGSMAGTVTNEDGYGVADLSGNYDAKSMAQGKSYTFSVNTPNADLSDIEAIYITQRITTSGAEYAKQLIYGNQGAEEELPSAEVTTAPEQEVETTTEEVVTTTEAPEIVTTTEEVVEPTTEEVVEPTTEEPAETTTPAQTTMYPQWDASAVYVQGDTVVYNGKVYRAKWWTTGDNPETCGQWGVWEYIGTSTETTTEAEEVTTTEEVVEPTTEEVVEPTTEEPVEPTTEEIVEPTTEEVVEPTTEEVVEPTTEPVEETTTATQTTVYPQWDASAVYVQGDTVVYNGNVYRAKWWTTGDNPETCGQWGVWEKVVAGSEEVTTAPEEQTTEAPVVSEPETQPEEETENNYTKNTVLPDHIVTGYWHNFVNGAANLKLSDVPSYYDLICVSFADSTSTPGEVTFNLNSDLCNAVGGYTKAEFIQDIKNLKAKGQHVILSVGGAEGTVYITSEAAANNFATSLIKVIEEYGFEGVDIDLEGSAVAGTAYIAQALRTVYNHFGENFIITMAPETYYMQSTSSTYFKLALDIKDILTVVNMQYYNSGSMVGYGGNVYSCGTVDFLTSLTALLIESGLRPDQVGIGVPSTTQAAGSGYVSNNTLIAAVNHLTTGAASGGSFTAPKKYESLRGVMTWSINWDATNGYAWAKDMDTLVDQMP